MPDFFPIRIFLAYGYGRLRRKEQARAEIAEILSRNAGYSLDQLKKVIPLTESGKLNDLLDSLHEAGLE